MKNFEICIHEKYENFVIVGDFNALETEQEIGDFMDLLALKNLVKEPTCFKSGKPTISYKIVEPP